MKILAIGDFHGRFPQKLLNKVKKLDFDIIVSPGDFCGNKKIEELFWKHCYGTDLNLSDVIEKKKYEKLETENLGSGIRVIKKLSTLKKPIIGITGNWDPSKWREIGFSYSRESGRVGLVGRFNRVLKKIRNLKITDYKHTKFLNYVFVGYPRSTYPGKKVKHITKKFRKRFETKEEAKKAFRKMNSDNKKAFKKLKKHWRANTIFISHNCPYNSKLDKLKKGPSRGKHYGSWLARKIIKELKPELTICGHMHENQGKCKIGKTMIVNPGAANEGKAAVIDIDDKKRKVKSIKFLK